MTCSLVQKASNGISFEEYTSKDIKITNPEDSWQIEYSTQTDAGYNSNFYVKCSTGQGFEKVSSLINIKVMPAKGESIDLIDGGSNG